MMRSTTLCWVLALASLWGCSGSGSGPTAASETPTPQPQGVEPPQPEPAPALTPTPAEFDSAGLLSGPGAPERSSCTTDADCVVIGIPNNVLPAPPPHLLGCCPAHGYSTVNAAFSQWITSFQASHCPADLSACPPLPAPSMPARCVMQARCHQGRCDNRCGAPDAGL